MYGCRLALLEVYPRVCGGTCRSGTPASPARGLSPRVRGNREAGPRGHDRPGSIPACAGEPPSSSANSSLREVYPRVCGGTLIPAIVRADLDGLSPRVRGNLTGGTFRLLRVGSIPACAGEPGDCHDRQRMAGVYPRVCGGTRQAGGLLDQVQGLSPRVRGNRDCRRHKPIRLGSIPACAGEPK